MNKLKENPGLLALSLAAVAAAGLIVYKGMSVKDTKDQDSDRSNSVDPVIEEGTVEDEVLENGFFMDPNATHQECEKLIVKWMNEQIDSLRYQAFDGKLKITARKLNQEDFYRVMMII